MNKFLNHFSKNSFSKIVYFDRSFEFMEYYINIETKKMKLLLLLFWLLFLKN